MHFEYRHQYWYYSPLVDADPGNSPEKFSIANITPCQYDAKIISLTHKNLPTGLNGFKSFQSTFQNIAKQYNDVVTLRLYSMVSHKYVEVALTSFTLYHPINSVSIVLTHITGFNQTYCKIPRLIIKNVVGSDISISGKMYFKIPG